MQWLLCQNLGIANRFGPVIFPTLEADAKAKEGVPPEDNWRQFPVRVLYIKGLENFQC
jgi:hypothetical protein